MTTFFIGAMALRLLLTAIFIIGLYKIIVLIRNKYRKERMSGGNRGIAVLKERLASGEIDEEKYRSMKSVLDS